MKKRTNYYKDLAADYSRPGLVAESLQNDLITLSLKINEMQGESPPVIGDDYPMSRIEQENKEWWPTHCEALRQGRGDILIGEYRQDLVYFCQDGAYYGVYVV